MLFNVDYCRKQTSHSHLWQKSRYLQKCGGDHVVVKTTGQHLFLLRELSALRHREHLVQGHPHLDGKLPHLVTVSSPCSCQSDSAAEPSSGLLMHNVLIFLHYRIKARQ